ncbi:hypothetical protein D9M68_846370 [compost metagenome]
MTAELTHAGEFSRPQAVNLVRLFNHAANGGLGGKSKLLKIIEQPADGQFEQTVLRPTYEVRAVIPHEAAVGMEAQFDQ